MVERNTRVVIWRWIQYTSFWFCNFSQFKFEIVDLILVFLTAYVVVLLESHLCWKAKRISNVIRCWGLMRLRHWVSLLIKLLFGIFQTNLYKALRINGLKVISWSWLQRLFIFQGPHFVQYDPFILVVVWPPIILQLFSCSLKTWNFGLLATSLLPPENTSWRFFSHSLLVLLHACSCIGAVNGNYKIY